MAKASLRRLASPQPRPNGSFLAVLRRRLSQRRSPSVARRRAPLLVLKTCEAHLYFGFLEMGTFHAARFKDDGTGEWLPLTFCQGPLISADGLGSEADILTVPSSILGTVPALTIHRTPGPSGPSPHVSV